MCSHRPGEEFVLGMRMLVATEELVLVAVTNSSPLPHSRVNTPHYIHTHTHTLEGFLLVAVQNSSLSIAKLITLRMAR